MNLQKQKHTLRRSLTALALVLGISATAQADTFSIGTLGDEPYINSVLHEVGSFLDVYNFSVAEVTNVAIGAVSNEIDNPLFGSILSIEGLKMGLFSASNPGLLAFPLAPGDYFVEVSGKADGRFGGAYLFSIATPVTPVPEPELWLSLIVGGSLVAAVAARRRA